MANMTIPTSRDIYLELNGRKLAVGIVILKKFLLF